MAKYELTDQTKVIKHPLTGAEVTLRRIRALESFVNLATGLAVRPGDLGGWVEHPGNLSQEGTCWLFDEACAFEQSRREGDSAGSGTSH
jgi:hypothetical protein